MLVDPTRWNAPPPVPTAAIPQWRLAGRIAGAVLAVGGMVATLAANRRLQKRLEQPSRADVEINDSTLVVIDCDSQTTFEWAYFDRFVETPTLLLLINGHECQVVPKRALGDDQDRVLQLFREKVSATGCFS